MNQESIINSFTPNSFFNTSDLVSLGKKIDLSKESLELINLVITNTIFYIILGSSLIFYFKVNFSVITILLGTEIILTFIAAIISFIKILALSKIDKQVNTKSYKEFLVTNEYYELIKSIWSVIGDSLSLVAIFYLFNKEISVLIIRNIPKTLSIDLDNIKNLIFIFLVLNVLGFIIRMIRYVYVKKIRVSDDFMDIQRTYFLINKKLQLVEYIPRSVVMIFVLPIFQVPLYIIGIFIFVLLVIFIVSIIEVQKIQNTSV